MIDEVRYIVFHARPGRVLLLQKARGEGVRLDDATHRVQAARPIGKKPLWKKSLAGRRVKPRAHRRAVAFAFVVHVNLSRDLEGKRVGSGRAPLPVSRKRRIVGGDRSFHHSDRGQSLDG